MVPPHPFPCPLNPSTGSGRAGSRKEDKIITPIIISLNAVLNRCKAAIARIIAI